MERGDIRRQLQLPCGQCWRCRLERSRQWAVRCVHEASLHEFGCFITLTYADEFLPYRSSLEYKHFQDFAKRMRKSVGPFRYFVAGEYGDRNDRPHFHACIFGYDFQDKVPYKKTDSGFLIYTSAKLSKLWSFGHSSIGDLNFETAAYTARYVMKKVNGRDQKKHYERIDKETGEIYSLEPEFCQPSLKPGIGTGWVAKYHGDVYPHDFVVINGKEVKPPKFYDRWYSKRSPSVWEDIQFMRESDGQMRYADNTPDRLADKEQVTIARMKFYKRSLT